MGFLPLLALFCLATPSQARYLCGWCSDARVEEFIEVKISQAPLKNYNEVDMDVISDSPDNRVEVSATRELCYVPSSPAPVIDGCWLAGESHFPPNGSWNAFLNSGDFLSDNVPTIWGCTDTQAANFNAHSNFEDGSCLYGPLQYGGHSTVTFDGYTYPLVGIGTQCWFQENLRSDNYRNGDAISRKLRRFRWRRTTVGAQIVYGEGSSLVLNGSGDAAANLLTYGRLYNGYAIKDSRGLCPTGFHVPNELDWKILEMALGMTLAEANTTGWHGTDQGSQMKSSSTETPSWNGSNTSGFSGLPGGYRTFDGFFADEGISGYWWNMSFFGGTRTLSWRSDVGRFIDYPQNGFSVRCVRD